ncbi:hypothetical protein B0I26_11318 [Anoxybacillus vitaminiphilus]|uniref:Uncharacterized protein n=1 Tax=Paranoxybacillus vitaminiphilus TaxID=581036 RepID=A0A327Y8L1_9BACL|nr:hypothetical protein [Anoxybacillus vitaminiphilus]RAK17154.1 hypothetical protein B0I26_11318 [Anoxybacillus vitaminiphilus]
MIVHELVGTENLFAKELKEGYYVIRKKYNMLDIDLCGAHMFQQIDCGTEEVVTVVFDPGNEYSLVCLGVYTFENKSPSPAELKQMLQTKHEELFQTEAVSA